MSKGSKPRNLSEQFKNNYDLIDWGHSCDECKLKTNQDVEDRLQHLAGDEEE